MQYVPIEQQVNPKPPRKGLRGFIAAFTLGGVVVGGVPVVASASSPASNRPMNAAPTPTAQPTSPRANNGLDKLDPATQAKMNELIAKYREFEGKTPTSPTPSRSQTSSPTKTQTHEVPLPPANKPASYNCDQAGIQAAIASITPTEMSEIMKGLVLDGNGKPVTRGVGQAGLEEKTKWFADQLTAAGMKVRLQAFTAGDNTINNIIGSIGPATGPINGFTAHIDTTDTSPGANNSGSGLSVMIAIARRLAMFNEGCFKSEINLIAPNNEEEGYGGIEAFSKMPELADRPLQLYTGDPVGYVPTPGKTCLRSTYYDEGGKAAAQYVADTAAKYGIKFDEIRLEKFTNRNNDGSVLAANAAKNGGKWNNAQVNYSNYVIDCVPDDSPHSPADTIDKVDQNQQTKVAQTFLAVLGEKAMNSAPVISGSRPTQNTTPRPSMPSQSSTDSEPGREPEPAMSSSNSSSMSLDD